MLLAMPVYTGLGAGVAELGRNKQRKGAASGHDAMHVDPHVPSQRATPRARHSMYALYTLCRCKYITRRTGKALSLFTMILDRLQNLFI